MVHTHRNNCTGDSITITIPNNHSTTEGLYYKCANHSGMSKDLSLFHKNVTGTTNNGSYDFYYGDVTVTVSGNFGTVSIYVTITVIWAVKIY